jgi:hypothetical protein
MKLQTISESQMALIQRLKAFLDDVVEKRTPECLKRNDAIFDPLEQETETFSPPEPL